MLIECKDCKNEVSVNAISCPKCGAPVEKPIELNANSLIISNAKLLSVSLFITCVFGFILTILFNKYLYVAAFNIMLRIIGFFDGTSSLQMDWIIYKSDVQSFRNDMWTGYIYPFGIICFMIFDKIMTFTKNFKN
jgi:hypothetical protein